jgi:HEAT repeat protein
MTAAEEKDPHIRSKTTDSEVRLVVDDELLQGKDLINVFIKTIKALRLYPADNPAVLGLKDQLFRRFQNYLEMYNSFALEIGEYDFSFKGKIVYEDQELKGSLPFLFFKDGLRELRFMEGIEEWEITGLTDIIIQRDNINEFEDDLITLIWEKDFIHISYIATDSFLEETPVLIPETQEEFRKGVNYEPMPASSHGDFEGEATGGAFDLDWEFYGKREEPAAGASGVYSLTMEELHSLHKEVEGELNPNFIFQVADILFEILGFEQDPEAYEDALGVLQKLLDALLADGEFQRASDFLNRVYILLNTYQLKDWQIQNIQHFLENLGDAKHIQRIGMILEKGTDLPLKDISAYLLLLKPNAVPGLIKILGDLNHSKGRRMLCDVVCEIGKTKSDFITQLMDDPRWYLVRNLAYILGRIGQESSMPYIQKAYAHPESRVRREAVQAAGLIGGPRAIALLTKALKDQDLRIRSMAGINLARVGKKTSLPLLLEVIQAKDFLKKDPYEVKAFFEAVGSIGSNEAIRPLQQILEHKVWFVGGVKDEVRLGAACALALIGTSEAKNVLQSGADSREDSIRQACLEARRRYGV